MVFRLWEQHWYMRQLDLVELGWFVCWVVAIYGRGNQ